MDQLQYQIDELKERNERVEVDKAREVSWTRKIIISIIIYIMASIFLYISEVDDFLLQAIRPLCGFLLSTLSLDMIKKYWIIKYNK